MTNMWKENTNESRKKGYSNTSQSKHHAMKTAIQFQPLSVSLILQESLLMN